MIWLEDHIKIKESMIVYLIKHTVEEPACCSHFGCGRQLTLRERLFSNKCSQHISTEINESKIVIASNY